MSNVQKTIAYFKRNGIVNTAYAVVERLNQQKNDDYVFVPASKEALKMQYEATKDDVNAPVFSILVPVYETPRDYLKAMIDSVLNQSYIHFELILADASITSGPKETIEEYDDKRIRYLKLSENAGISENTNRALEAASGSYCVLCDHDDLLTEDALYEIYAGLVKGRKKNKYPVMVYTDEDKCDGEGSNFREVNKKADINLDMLLSNNYICHITVIETNLIKSLGFRKEYDGAQDFDLVLRLVSHVLKSGEKLEDCIYHVPKVLYHWRCHEASTAANPESKNYAYEAGKRAIEDFVKDNFGKAEVSHLLHKGFYRVDYKNEIFDLRQDIGAIGGYVTCGNKITSGAYDENGNNICLITNIHHSGVNHVGAITRDVFSLDLRSLTPSPKMREIYADLLNKWQEEIRSFAVENGLEPSLEIKEEMLKKYNLEFGRMAEKMGLRLLLDPKYRAFDPYKSRDDLLPVSVVIPNYNGKQYLNDCLSTLYASTKLPYEVIVIDNASTDGSVEFLKESYPQVKVYEHGINTGFTGASNHGINLSGEKYVFLLNNDTTIEKDCLEKLVNAMEIDESIFSAGALMLSMDKPELVDNGGDSMNLLGYPKSFLSGKTKLNICKDRVAPVFSACAGASMYRKSILDKIDLLDELHFAYFEDVDLGYRARIYGYKNVNVRNAIVYHKGSATSGSKHNAFKVSLSSKNSVLLHIKNMPFLQYVCNLPFLLIGYIVKFAFFTLKGLGKEYLKGIITGFKLAFSKEGRAKHVKFKFKHMLNYFYIQMWFLLIQ
ncbi:MAG: glycosyltransferase [Lachnospiraceae bacterium]|nr:glycosyltransferase [Lachnospiraceae bacterium]